MLMDRKKTETIQVLAMMQTRYYVDSVSLYIHSQGANSLKMVKSASSEFFMFTYYF